jgi:methionine synthase II (cobalamin-independent)
MKSESHKTVPDFHFIPTGIGSVPWTDVEDTCDRILKYVPEAPFWPQFVRLSFFEDMIAQFCEGLTFLHADESTRKIRLASREVEDDLVAFYDRYLAEDVDAFAITESCAAGFHGLLKSIRTDPGYRGPYIKGQTVGPVTFSLSIKDNEGKSAIHHPDLVEAIVKGLSIKALWQVQSLAATGKRPILFIDEPALSGFGSAFSPIQRHDVIAYLKEVMGFLRERADVLIGIHCCGNTDWAMILDAGPDIVNFDAYSFMDPFFLYTEEIKTFVRAGGTIAWGIVPTGEKAPERSIDHLARRLEEGLDHLVELGLDADTVSRRSMLTPACGMGTMEPGAAANVMENLCELASRRRNR